MKSNSNYEVDIQEVTANTCILVWSSDTDAASACRYNAIPMLFRQLGQLKTQCKVLCCPGRATSLQLEKTF